MAIEPSIFVVVYKPPKRGDRFKYTERIKYTTRGDS